MVKIETAISDKCWFIFVDQFRVFGVCDSLESKEK